MFVHCISGERLARPIVFRLIACAVVAIFASFAARAHAQDQTGATKTPLHLHVIAACGEYDAEASLRKWAEKYEKERNVRFSWSVGKDGDEDLPNLEEVAKANLVVLFARRLKLKPEPLAKIAARWEAGKPILGLRTASHAFDNETNAILDGQVFGGAYQNHLGDQPVEVTIRESAKESPLLEGVKPFASSKLYKAGKLADDVNVLLDGRTGDEVYPVAWTHEYHGGRMFYSSLGVQTDFDDANFLRLLDNAVQWLTEKRS